MGSETSNLTPPVSFPSHYLSSRVLSRVQHLHHGYANTAQAWAVTRSLSYSFLSIFNICFSFSKVNTCPILKFA